jgi:hypothetical protein
MKRFSEIQKKSKVLRRINEADESNLPSNYEDMSKEELIKLMSGQNKSEEVEETEEETEDEGVSTSNESNGDVSKFISKLLESREMAQVYHWTVKGDMGSHAAHLALEAYYDGVIEHIDEIVEVYQGQYGLIEGYDQIATDETKSKDRLDYFKEVVEFVKRERTCVSDEDTHLHNLIDEVVALLYRTIYKLTYNK